MSMIRKFNSRIIHTNLDIKSVGCLPFEVGRNVFMAVSASLQQRQDSSSTHTMVLSLSLASEALLAVEHYGHWVRTHAGRNLSGLMQVALHLN